MKNKLLQKWN